MKNMNEEATSILRRANARGVSISDLCREVGVSRTWFEHFKQRVPKSVETYLRIDRALSGEG